MRAVSFAVGAAAILAQDFEEVRKCATGVLAHFFWQVFGEKFESLLEIDENRI